MKKYFVVATLAVAGVMMTSCKKDADAALANAKDTQKVANDKQKATEDILKEMEPSSKAYHAAKEAMQKTKKTIESAHKRKDQEMLDEALKDSAKYAAIMEEEQKKYDPLYEKLFEARLEEGQAKKHAGDAAHEAGKAIAEKVKSNIEKPF